MDAHNYSNMSRPLFNSINEPSPHIVGHIMSVNCGHTGHPSPAETLMMDLHLKKANFFENDEKHQLPYIK